MDYSQPSFGVLPTYVSSNEIKHLGVATAEATLREHLFHGPLIVENFVNLLLLAVGVIIPSRVFVVFCLDRIISVSQKNVTQSFTFGLEYA